MKQTSRKEALKQIVVLPALAGLALAGTSTIAQAKSSKAAMKYQNTPKGSAKCSGCSLFIPGKTTKANGTCKVVEGSISPNGWCVAYTPKA